MDAIRIEMAAAGGPIYEQIAAQVMAARARSELAPGERLPAVRELAAQLGVNRNTVAHAYRLLRQNGVLGGRAGQGTRVLAERSAANEQQALVRCLGSHDFCLDLLARRLRGAAPGFRLLCEPVGSTAGLLALGRGEAQIAGLHLRDPATGEFNWPAVRRLLPGHEIRLITLVEREQGLIVRRGNPLGLRNIADLARPGLRFAGRQLGSGTHLLLEYLLGLHRLRAEQLAPPVQVLTTHLAVAAAVAGGKADAGLGVPAAARALDLDFIPLATERYDLAFRQADENRAWLAALLETLASPALRADIEALAGYDATHTAWMNL